MMEEKKRNVRLQGINRKGNLTKKVKVRLGREVNQKERQKAVDWSKLETGARR